MEAALSGRRLHVDSNWPVTVLPSSAESPTGSCSIGSMLTFLYF